MKHAGSPRVGVPGIHRRGRRWAVTKHGQPAAVMLNVDDLESLEETLHILSNPTLRDAIREGEADLASGRTHSLTKDEALARISER